MIIRFLLIRAYLKIKLLILFLFLFMSNFAFCTQETSNKSYKLTHPLYEPGLFSVFHTVLGALDFYEKSENCEGLILDFEDQGPYYDEKYGSNWWEYYFEPIKVGTLNAPQLQKFPTYKKALFSLEAQFKMSLKRGSELIQKYVRLKPAVQKKIDLFISTHFKSKTIIGIHYRGTDKKIEAPEVSYSYVTELVARDKLLSQKNTKIFVATDDTNFLIFMNQQFPGKIIATNAIRSDDGTPVLYSHWNEGYQKGEDAILDCILLSKCTKLYKMASNLSDASVKFNPSIPVVQINKNYSEEIESTEYNMFKTLNVVIALLNQYEQNKLDGVRASFPIKGRRGAKISNWWNRFFKPLNVGNPTDSTKILGYDNTIIGLTTLFEMPTRRAYTLLRKYIKIKPKILAKVKTFIAKNFKTNHIIGIHYIKQQGSEYLQASIPYKQLFRALERAIKSTSKKSTIFVSTNDQTLFNKLRKKYPNVIYYNELITDEQRDLINCILLSNCNMVIGTSSDLLKTVSQFNPKVRIKELDTYWLLKK